MGNFIARTTLCALGCAALAPVPNPVVAQRGVTVALGATRQLPAFAAREGDSLMGAVVFSAAGGTITSEGLYTAGSVPGTFMAIASSGELADTSFITVTAPLGSSPREPITPVPGRDRTGTMRPPGRRYEVEERERTQIVTPDGVRISHSRHRKERWTFYGGLALALALGAELIVSGYRVAAGNLARIGMAAH